MSAAIEVLEIRAVDAGNLRAFVKVRVGGLVLHGCRVVQQPGQRAWVAMPQVPARKSGGGWFPVVEITSPDLKARINGAILEAWEARHASSR